MKQLQLYAEDGVRGKIAHGSAHVIGGLPRQPEDQMGYDFDDTVEQLEAEQEMLTEKGLAVSVTTGNTVPVETEED